MSMAPSARWPAVAGARAAARRHRAGRFHRLRFPQMGPGALRRRFSWCATASGTATLSPRRRPICAARRAGWRPARPGPATSAPICRAASARSRPGSPSRSMAPRRWARRCRAAARWRAIWSSRSRPSRSWNCWRRRSSTSSASATARDADALNAEIVADLQESGIAAPSTTTLDGRSRSARPSSTTAPKRHIDALIDTVLRLVRRESKRPF